MKIDNFKNYLRNTLSITLVVLIGILFYFCLQNLKEILNSIAHLLSILSPIIYGVVIAYLLSPICNFLDIKFRPFLLKQIKDSKKAIKTSNLLSTCISFLSLVLILIFIFSLVIPQLIFTVSSMIESLPSNIEIISNNLEKMIKENKFMSSKTGLIWAKTVTYIEEFLGKNVLPNLDSIIFGVSGGIAQVIKEVSNLIIGLVVSVYCLSSRKTFARQGKKFIYACMRKKHADFFIKELHFIDKAFSEFISGKLIEALIVGILCFLGMSVIGSQYTLLISVIIGITNIIPFFGPFIGGIPVAILLLFESPIKCLYFIIFLIVLIQIDGNILGPKILSNSTGLTGFWIIFSIIFFGGLFGIIGMLIGIPLFSVMYKLASDWVNYMMKIRKEQKRSSN